MNDNLTGEQLDEHIARLWISAPASMSYKAARLLKIERTKVKRLEDMIQAMGENLDDERQAHVAEVIRLNGLLGDDLRSTPYIEVKHWE